jgi:hypothetical protein
MDHELAARYEQAITRSVGPAGRIISGSKSGYRDRYPDHLPVFNANVCLGSSKVWHGDLDLTLDEPKLLELAAHTGQITYVLYEHDGRFRHEDHPLINDAVYSAVPSGHTMFDPRQAERRVDGQLYARPYPRPPRWRVPARPQLWRFWKISTETERPRTKDGTQTSRFLRIGRTGTPQRAPLLVLALHTWRREARGYCVEWTWYPTSHHSWAPGISGRAKWRHGKIRPYASVGLSPGIAHTLRAGINIGPIDFLLG